MVVVVGNESFRPGAYALIKSFSDGLVWKEEGNAMRVEGGDSVAFDEREGVYDG